MNTIDFQTEMFLILWGDEVMRQMSVIKLY